MKNYILDITLEGIEPEIKREISVPEGITFATLHDFIQIVFGWGNYHMYEFEIPERKLEITCDYERVAEYNDYIEFKKSQQTKKEFANTISVDRLYENELLDTEYAQIDEYMEVGKEIDYVYDFGDYWEHKIKVKKVIEVGSQNAKLIKASGITPPDDVGGPEGYKEVRDVLENPNSDGYEEMMEWARTTGYTGKLESTDVINERLLDPKKYFKEIDMPDFDMDDVISDTLKWD